MTVSLIVGTAKGAAVARSDAKRERWQVDALAVKGWIVTAATRDAGGRYYLGVASEVYGAAIVASGDLKTFEQLDAAPRYAATDVGNADHNRIAGAADPDGRHQDGGRHVDQIWKLLAVGDVIYAGVSEAGVFRSEDRGKSWQVLPGLNDHPARDEWGPGFGGLCAHSLLVDGREPRRLWVGISAAGVFRSEDGGETFVSANEGVSRAEGYCVHSIAHDPQKADVIYRQDHRGMYRTGDGGDSWEGIENGLPIAELSDGRRCVFGFPIALHRGSGSVFSVPLEGDNFRYPHDGKLRVYRTRDGGEHWEPSAGGLPDDSYGGVLRGAMDVDSLDPAGVYFGTTAGAVYTSRDDGERWSALPVTLPKVLSVDAFAD